MNYKSVLLVLWVASSLYAAGDPDQSRNLAEPLLGNPHTGPPSEHKIDRYIIELPRFGEWKVPRILTCFLCCTRCCGYEKVVEESDIELEESEGQFVELDEYQGDAPYQPMN